jgi:chromatin remodeling complex protein RSC6
MPTTKKKPARRTAKKTTTRKTTKKATRKPARKTTARKTAKKKPARKTTARKTTRKPAARKKAAARKGTARKSTARKGTTRRATSRKPAKKKTARKPNAAFMRPVTPSSALAEVVGAKAMPRTEVTKKLWAYIKKNKLQDQVNKRMINADPALKRVFGGKSKVNMFEMTKLVSKHLS